jgi:hypothetical protein
MRIDVLAPRVYSVKKDTTQLRFRNEPASLPENRVERASVDFLMIWNRQRLRLAVFENAANLDVAASLRNRTEVELPENG